MNTPITVKSQAIKQPQKGFELTQKHKLALAYLSVAVLPFVLAQLLGMEFTGLYTSVLSAVNLLAMMVFFIQFPLAGRLKKVPLFSNIDWGITQHKKLGKYLGIFFFLHPIFIVLPKALMSADDLSVSVWSIVTSPHLLTALIAWCAMAIWVLMSIYKDRLNLRYETWRLMHVTGFAIIATLATLHITTIGSHGQFNPRFNTLWWLLYGLSMTLLIYNYVIKPKLSINQAYSISSIEKITDSDWQLSIQNNNQTPLAYQAGQFVWINTSGNPYSLEQHPFSIVSATADGQVNFAIRALGDYTSSLGKLKPEQVVYIDGPYGNMTLTPSQFASGITLIAGGAGISPMLSLLSQLAKQQDQRPIRLLYANHNMSRMIYLETLAELQRTMANFKVQLVCEYIELYQTYEQPNITHGLIQGQDIVDTVTKGQESQWAYYLCGPAPMISNMRDTLHRLGVSNNQIHYEQLTF